MTKNELVSKMIESKDVEYKVAKKATLERLEAFIQRLEEYKADLEKGGVDEMLAVMGTTLLGIVDGREAQLMVVSETTMYHAMLEKADLNRILNEEE